MEKKKHKWSPLEIVLYALEILFCAIGLSLVIYSLLVDGVNLTAYSGLCIIASRGLNMLRRRNNLSSSDWTSMFLLAVALVLYIMALLL